ncbi:hypothetical protein AVEN_143689-1 [Araneus ventricosus]|uniref:Uncharacterized protein n=1 Tax=Araneus ventricosus TaxID=182803 RepID=A0A4Y2AQU7_ARAVE|nr:hypothetical protein AVEN_143689-1 [Araneus ventricosus]
MLDFVSDTSMVYKKLGTCKYMDFSPETLETSFNPISQGYGTLKEPEDFLGHQPSSLLEKTTTSYRENWNTNEKEKNIATSIVQFPRATEGIFLTSLVLAMFHNIFDTVPERPVGNTDNLYFILDGGSHSSCSMAKARDFGDVYTTYMSYIKGKVS